MIAAVAGGGYDGQLPAAPVDDLSVFQRAINLVDAGWMHQIVEGVEGPFLQRGFFAGDQFRQAGVPEAAHAFAVQPLGRGFRSLHLDPGRDQFASQRAGVSVMMCQQAAIDALDVERFQVNASRCSDQQCGVAVDQCVSAGEPDGTPYTGSDLSPAIIGWFAADQPNGGEQ